MCTVNTRTLVQVPVAMSKMGVLRGRGSGMKVNRNYIALCNKGKGKGKGAYT